jgi:hypothetical protein
MFGLGMWNLGYKYDPALGAFNAKWERVVRDSGIQAQ